MGRGADNITETPARVNRLSRRVRVPSEKEEAEKAKSQAEELARVERIEELQKEAISEEKARLQEEAHSEEFEIRYMKARILLQQQDPEKTKILIDEGLAAIEERKRERESASKAESELLQKHAKERSLLEERGIFSFEDGSPGREALFNKALYEDNYSYNIKPVTDPFLQEEGKSYAFSVTLERGLGRQVVDNGFATTQKEAEVMAEEVIRNSINRELLDLLEENKVYEEKSGAIRKKKEELERELQDKNLEDLQRIEETLAEREELKEKFASIGIDIEDLRVNMKGEVTDDGVPFFYQEGYITDVRINSMGNIDIITYVRRDSGYPRRGYIEAIIYRDKKIYATTESYAGFLRTAASGYDKRMLKREHIPSLEDAETQKALRERVEKRIEEEFGRQSSLQKRFGRFLPSNKKEEIAAKEREKDRRRSDIGYEERLKEVHTQTEARREPFLEAVKEAVSQEIASETFAKLR